MKALFLGKRLIPLSIVLILFSGYGVAVNAAGQSSDNFIIPNDVISTGGGERLSSSFIVNDTVGQSSPIGISTGTDVVLHGGFWGPMEPAVVPTATPAITPTVTVTPTMAPVPATGPLGGITLLIVFGILFAATTRMRKFFK